MFAMQLPTPEFYYDALGSQPLYPAWVLAQDKVIPADQSVRRMARGIGLTYGYGSPHRPHAPSRSSATPRYALLDEAFPMPVSAAREWRVLATFPHANYMFKMHVQYTGARVNLISVADISGHGYVLVESSPLRMVLVGFNLLIPL